MAKAQKSTRFVFETNTFESQKNDELSTEKTKQNSFQLHETLTGMSSAGLRLKTREYQQMKKKHKF